MKIIIIGNLGSGKSTLARKVQAQTQLPLLQLDTLWHTTDYSDAAQECFLAQQQQFMRQPDWIIEGNYKGSLKQRVVQADLIIWLKVSRSKAVYRVIKRSLRFKRSRRSRPEMPAGFSEHFDQDYWAFLKTVWAYDNAGIERLVVTNKRASCQLLVLKTSKAKKRFLSHLQRD